MDKRLLVEYQVKAKSKLETEACFIKMIKHVEDTFSCKPPWKEYLQGFRPSGFHLLCSHFHINTNVLLLFYLGLYDILGFHANV